MISATDKHRTTVMMFITVRNVVAARQCFCTCLLFCSLGHLTDTPWHTPQADISRADTPWADTRTPLWAETPRADPPGDGHYSGRYASYWNGFLVLN